MIQNIKLIFYISITFINTTPNKNFRYAPLWERTIWDTGELGMDNFREYWYLAVRWNTKSFQ